MSFMATKDAEPIPHCQPISFRMGFRRGAEYIPRMEKPDASSFKLRVRMRIAELGISVNAAAVRSGLDRDTVRKMLRQEAGLPEMSTIVKLSEGLEIPVDKLLGDRGAPQTEQPPPNNTVYVDEEVEIKAVAAGSYQGAFQLFDSSIGRTPLPRGLKRFDDVYAIIIINDSMYPEHKPGELRFATPSVRPKIGDSVVIQFERDPDIGPEAMIGRLLKNGSMVKLGKLNPAGEIDIDSGMISRMHRLATNAEVNSI